MSCTGLEIVRSTFLTLFLRFEIVFRPVTDSQPSVSISIFHKPRAAGRKQWTPIEANERVRVSSKSGKHIIVLVKLDNPDPSGELYMNSESCSISLIQRDDGEWKPVTKAGYFATLSCEDSGAREASFNVRVSCRLPRVAICVHVLSPYRSEPIVGYSVPFIPHNSGAPKTKTPAEPESPPESSTTPRSDPSVSSPTSQPMPTEPLSPTSVIEGDLLINGSVTARECSSEAGLVDVALLQF